MTIGSYETINVDFQESVCFVQIDRPETGNTIDGTLIEECNDVLAACEESASIVVLSGTPEVFCFGADFKSIAGGREQDGPEPLYDIWLRLANGTFVTISLVRGIEDDGGLGFGTAIQTA